MNTENNTLPPVIRHGKSQPYFSMAIAYGGFTSGGRQWTYVPKYDIFIEKKHLSAFRKAVKGGTSPAEFLLSLKRTI